ncbi:hypothetical protein CRX67_09530 [Enterobacteriaceae bacterium A-F18]|nr:hypothetical protein C9415_22515 [Kluyvera sp. Nf5]QIH63338.1 hypothetical protein CRX67_09530 [Enterobacteriaceae bacterium A-F18]HEO9916648.1 hypothetical protein [Enterobacter asburiae]
MSSRQVNSIKTQPIGNAVQSTVALNVTSNHVNDNSDIVLSIRQAKSIAELWLDSLSGRENLDSYLLAGIITFLSSAEKRALNVESKE